MESKQPGKRMTSRDLQAVHRRQQILQTAKQLFASKGYHAVSMRELNKAIGMADALTYHYFPGGKFEILTTVLQTAQEERIGGIVLFFQKIFAKTDLPLSHVLTELIVGLAQKLTEDQAYFQILLRERSLLSDEQKEALDSVTHLPFEAMSDYLSQRAEQGDIRHMDFSLAASQFLAHIVFTVIQQLLRGNRMEQEEARTLSQFYMQLWAKPARE